MRTTTMVIALLGLAGCARPPSGSYEEPPPERVGTNETMSVVITEDFELGARKVDQLVQDDDSAFLVGELSPRLNPLRGSGSLLLIATPQSAAWFFRPIVAAHEWDLYTANVEYEELHVRAFVHWVLVCDVMLEPTQSMIVTHGTAGRLPALVEVRAPHKTGEAEHAHLFHIE